MVATNKRRFVIYLEIEPIFSSLVSVSGVLAATMNSGRLYCID